MIGYSQYLGSRFRPAQSSNLAPHDQIQMAYVPPSYSGLIASDHPATFVPDKMQKQ